MRAQSMLTVRAHGVGALVLRFVVGAHQQLGDQAHQDRLEADDQHHGCAHQDRRVADRVEEDHPPHEQVDPAAARR